jgi:hypothetical protein
MEGSRMSMPVDYQIVAYAYDLIEDRANWIQGALAERVDGEGVDPLVEDAYRFCAFGALKRATHVLTPYAHGSTAEVLAGEVKRKLESFAGLPSERYADLEDLNDIGAGGHQRVVGLFERYLRKIKRV